MELDKNSISVYKIRSVTSCLSKGYALFMANVRTLCVRIAPTLLPLSLCYTAIYFIQHAILQSAALLLFVVLLTLYLTQLFDVLRSFCNKSTFNGVATSRKTIVWKKGISQSNAIALVSIVVIAALSVLSFGIVSYFLPITLSYSIKLSTVLWLILSTVLTIPCIYTMVHCLLSEKPLSKRIYEGLKQSLYSYGAIFSIVLVGIIAVVMAQLFMGMMSTVLTLAQQQALQSAAEGATVELPSHLMFWFPISRMISFLAIQIALLGSWISLMFLYGSIAARVSERESYEKERERILSSPDNFAL